MLKKVLGMKMPNRKKLKKRETFTYRDLYHLVKRLSIVLYMYSI